MATYIEQSLKKLEEFEGCVPWMYVDTVGKVTVGVGFMLPDAPAAQALPFLIDGQPALAAQIAADFARVTAMPMGKAPVFYRHSDSPQLAQPTIDAKLLATLQSFETHLRAALSGYDEFPDCVKLALLDMAYNLGPAGLLKDYPHMLAAVKQGHWSQAALECERNGPSAARNAWTKAQFMAAVVGTITAEAEGWLSRMWLWIRSLWR